MPNRQQAGSYNDRMTTRSKRPTVLLTGFDPFDGDADNPSWQAARLLHGRQVAGHRIVARELPTEFGTSLKALRSYIHHTKPTLVLGTGVAANRHAISIERIAINVDDARIPDHAGCQPVDSAVCAGAPAAYFSTLPIKAMLAALQGEGIPAEVSQNAGTFVCNHVFYGLMHALRKQPATRAGFVHVPFPSASLPIEGIARALRIALHAALTTGHDLRIPAGAND